MHRPLTLPAAPSVPAAAWTNARRAVLELDRHEPVLTRLALIFLIAMLPTLLAAQVDPRTVHGISVWVKPTKFLLSLAVFFLTLAWVFHAVTPAARQGRAGRYVVAAAATAGVLEMVWLLGAAVAGVPAHFNRDDPVWAIAYGLGGVGSVTLLSTMVVQGWLVQRHPRPGLPPALKQALVLGAWLGAALTLVTAGYLSARTGHWVGGAPTDAGGLPLLGWSRDGGDLRVAHFVALHLHQLLPLLALAVLAVARRWAGAAVTLGAVLGTLATAAVFVQALAGRPLIA